jgi:hypothetical protein
MYGATIPEDDAAEAMVSNLPRKQQAPARRFGFVLALCVGVVIGALGTMVLMAGGPEAPSPLRAAMELDALDTCHATNKKLHQQIMSYYNGNYEGCMYPCSPDTYVVRGN